MGILQQVRFIPTYVGYTYWLIYGASRRPVHPHIRGAYRRGRAAETYSIGSSPHTWGIPADELPGTVQALVHPHIRGAYGVAERVQPTQSVHPHIRGAYRFWASECSCRIGSSPHTWGIHRIEPECQLQDRFIPTYVGHSGGGVATVSYSSVHPHIRGAYLTTCTLALSPSGSSPHTWGIQRLQISTGQLLRFIPTYVGHTRAGSPPILRRTVHPHIRGAYSGSGKSRSLKNGSSPHTWGIHRRYQPFRAGSRFIPTYVGHTSTVAARVASSTGSSPHTWGIRRFLVGVQDADGSSPHTWGIPEPHKFQAQRVRFIPTYVGHTHPLQLPGKLPTVHPHIRGAYSYLASIQYFASGSSPHTWGILRC